VDGLVLLHERDRRQRDGGSRTSSPPPSKELREPEAVTGR
jgi:hypothetical protein